MSAVIGTNIASINTQRNLSSSSASLSQSLQRLSSGMRVNSAKDDAAGMSIATRIESVTRGQTVAIRNANDAISLSQTAEGALGKVGDSLQRMRELAVQSANATNTTDDRANLQTEFSQLQSEVTRVIANTKFNGTAILSAASPQTFQVGSGTTLNEDTIDIAAVTLTETTSAISAATEISTDATAARTAMDQIDKAIGEINTGRATYGAAQNRFSAAISNLQVSVENQSSARSRIMDADFASETASLSRAQILQQAGTAMLAQANSLPNGVLALLRG